MWSRHVRAASMARNLYFLGTAGSGKSTMVYAFQLWMNSQGLDCVTVNLDPGAESLLYLNDPALVKSASGFVSSVLLSATVQFRHGLPFVNVLSKSDLLSEEELERIVKWSLDPFALYEGLFADGATPKTLLDVEFLKSMESIGVYRRVHPVSSEITFGFDEIYNQVQQVFEGGEDLQKD